MDILDFVLVTPEATFFSGAATLVEAPGTLGDFGVLPGHMDFVSTLRPGVIAVHEGEGRVTRVFVAGGLAEVNQSSCTILAERVLDFAKLTRAEAEAQLLRARADLENALDETAINNATRDVDFAEALVSALS